MKTPTLDKTIGGLYVGYKDINPPYQWSPLALLTWDESEYHFQITQIGFQILDKYPGFWVSFPECKNGKIYQGRNLPEIFKKRMPWGREDDRDDFNSFDLDYKQPDGIALLARSGGMNCIDPFDICPLVNPDRKNSTYRILFSPDILQEAEELVKTIPIGAMLDYSEESNLSISIKFNDIKIGHFPEYFNCLNFIKIEQAVRLNSDWSYLEWRLLIDSHLVSDGLYSHSIFTL